MFFLVSNMKLLLPLVGKENNKVGELKIALSGTVGRLKAQRSSSVVEAGK